MNISKSLVVVGMVLLTTAGAAVADQTISFQQNISKRPLAVAAKADAVNEAWEGASLKLRDAANAAVQAERQQLNALFASKRAYQG